MEGLLSITAAIIALGGYVPYARDIVKGTVKPARSARIMFAVLLTVSILQQHQLSSGWLIAITAGELIGSFGILLLSLKRGVGGLSRIDIACYLLIIIDIIIWQTTGNTLLALHLSILADMIAFTPTIIKTWRQPWTETPLFFIAGFIAPLLNIVAVGKYEYAVILFPAYLFVANLAETLIIMYRQSVTSSPHTKPPKDHQPIN